MQIEFVDIQIAKKAARNIMVIAACCLPLMLAGAETERTEESTAEAIPAPVTATAKQGQPGDEQVLGSDQAPPQPGKVTEPLKEFKPTDRIEADSAVSFPVDI